MLRFTSGVVAILLTGCGSVGIPRFDGEERSLLNFHTVEEGRLYRSAQPILTDVTDRVREHGIKTIINLRGAHPGEFEYDQEKRLATELGVAHFDIEMSARRLPHRDDLRELFRLFDEAEYPIWIHCAAGADRTGEAAALYAMEYMGQSREQALEQLTPRFFHLESQQPSKRYFVGEVYVDKAWALSEYDPCQADYRFYDKETFCSSDEP